MGPRRSIFKDRVNSKANRFYELRRKILDVANIDIDIPWVDHVRLRCFDLYDKLYYPDDYQPSVDHAL